MTHDELLTAVVSCVESECEKRGATLRSRQVLALIEVIADMQQDVCMELDALSARISKLESAA